MSRRAWVILALGATCGCSRSSVLPDSADFAAGQEVRPLPTRYLADRFAVAPVTERGDTLEFYTDTGGGLNMLWASAAPRLQMKPTPAISQGDTLHLVDLPAFAPSAWIPLPHAPEPRGARLVITPPDNGIQQGRDGFLGRHWFANRVWVFDYPGQALSLLAHGPKEHAEHQVPLHFQHRWSGRRTTQFPRIRIDVDGEALDLLLDSGATVALAESAQAALAALGSPGAAERGTSFITQSRFDAWRGRHPDWHVVPAADRLTHMPVIEVPRVTIAGYEVGPVWFTMRPDRNFHEYMSQWMDQKIDGALGGSALKYFRVTVDYPNGRATFEKP